MTDERKRCPKCGADFDRMVCDGVVFQFNCGTLQDRTRMERVIESEDCLRRQLAQAQERLAEAERVNSALDAALVSARRQLEQALAREAELRRERDAEDIGDGADDRGWPTRESERTKLVAEVGECCRGADPLCAIGCLVEAALRKRLVDKEGTA